MCANSHFWHASSRVAAGTVVMLGLFVAGCSQPAQTENTAVNAKAPTTAAEILSRMASVYQEAKTYADSGQIRLKFQRGSEKVDETVDLAVSLSRPNKLRLNIYQAMVASDGKDLKASLSDLSGQVLQATLGDQAALDVLYRDPVLQAVLTEGIVGGAPQLSLLLDNDPLQPILDGAESTEILSPAEIHDSQCYRVVVKRPAGNLVFWIDQETFILRRLDYPTKALHEQLAKQAKVEGLALWAEFVGAKVNGQIDDVAFQFDVPEGARLVEAFDTRGLMPAPPEPSELLGSQVPDFTFERLDGEELSGASLKGKTIVLDFWATWCKPCMAGMPDLAKVYDQFADNPDIAFLAVSIDTPDVANDVLEEAFAKLGIDIPIVRDPQLFARDAFKVEGIPNLFIIGPDGIVQENEIGLNPRRAEELPKKIETLLAGGSLYEQALARYLEQKKQYETAQKAPPPSAPANSASGPPAAVTVTPASEPGTLKLTKLWEADQISQPGNILVVEESDGDGLLLINDGWRSVTALDTAGKVLEQHALEIPSSAVVSYLRTGTDASGSRVFVGSASTQRQLHIWDQAWKLRFSYPESNDAEIADVQVDDLDGDGTSELLVSYWDNKGVECLTLDGESRWSERSLENVFRLAVVSSDADDHRSLVCTHSKGTLARIDHLGTRSDDFDLDGRFIRHVVARDLDGDGNTELCGLAPVGGDRESIVGIAPDGSIAWEYELPAGLHQQPIEMIIAGNLPDGPSGHWIVAAADGSIHLLSGTGELIDRFNYGAELTGIATARVNDKSVLFISTPKKVEAWSAEPM